MKFSILFFSLVGLVLSVQAKGGSMMVNFGKVRPVETMVATRTLPLAVNKIAGFVVEGDLFLADKAGEKLPMERLKLGYDDRLYELKKTYTEINLESPVLSKGLDWLQLSLELTPLDSSGEYQGTVTIKPWIDTPNGKLWMDEIKILIKVEILPWVRLQIDQKQMSLEQTLNEIFCMQNSEPLIIKISANTRWILFIDISGSEGNGRKNGFPLEISGKRSRDNHYQVQAIPELTVKSGKKPLAVGGPTIRNGGYWAELILLITLNNYFKYPAGKTDFQIRFTAEPWDGKTV